MKSWYTCIGTCILLIIGGCGMKNEELDADSEQSTEAFIYEWLKNDNNTLATYIQDSDQVDEDLVSGREALAETIGLWMFYALDKNDQELFDEIYEQLNEYFLETNGFVHWKLTETGQSEVSTNALIDDLRISEALLDASDKWEQEKYRNTADLISGYLTEHNINQNIYTDFFEREDNYPSADITLSYIDIEAMKRMAEAEQLERDAVEETILVLTEAPIDNGFYPKSYNVETDTYSFDDDVNIVDQAITAYHYAREGNDSEAFLKFIEHEMDRRGLVHGMYDRETGEPVVEYESPAIYGFLVLYLLEIGETELADEVFERLKDFKVEERDSEYFGGYSITDGDTHIFDNLVPLLAEQRMNQ